MTYLKTYEDLLTFLLADAALEPGVMISEAPMLSPVALKEYQQEIRTFHHQVMNRHLVGTDRVILALLGVG